MKRVVLVVPPMSADACSSHVVRVIVFGVHAMLLKRGLQAGIQDYFDDPKGFRRYVASLSSEGAVYCVPAFISNWSNVRSLVAAIRRVGKSAAKVVLFGPLAVHYSCKFLTEGVADVVVLADPEFVIPALIAAPSWSVQALGRIGPVAFQSKGRVVRTLGGRSARSLDRIPFVGGYFLERGWPVALLTSRGCPFLCTFCDRHALFGKVPRFRSERNVLQELRWLSARGAREVLFNDDNFVLSRRRTKRMLLQMIRAKLPVQWACNSRIDAVTPEILRLMRLAGCVMVHYGVETGSPEVGDFLGKNFCADDVVRTVELTRRAGMRVGVYVIVGAPPEGAAAFQQTIALLSRLRPINSVDVNPLAMLPGTRLYAQHVRRSAGHEDALLDKPWPCLYQPGATKRCALIKRMQVRLYDAP